MTRRSLVTRAIASVLLIGGVATTTAACTFVTPQTTLKQYDASDGVGTTVGQLLVRNALAITAEDGTSVALLMTFVNSSDRSLNINLEFESDGQQRSDIKQVPANGVLSIGNSPGDEQIVVQNPGVKVGALMPVYVQYGDNPGSQMLVPVLPAEGIYADLGPTPTPSATPSTTPTPTPTPSATP